MIIALSFLGMFVWVAINYWSEEAHERKIKRYWAQRRAAGK